MKILIIAPAAGIPIPPAGYGGIESLLYGFTRKLCELTRGVNVEIYLAASKYSYVPGIKEHIETVDFNKPNMIYREDLAAKSYFKRLKEFDAIMDMSHRKVAGRLRKLPAVHILWHGFGSYPEPKYNLMALSNWHANAMKEIYHQAVRYLHMGVDTDFYAPKPNQKIEDYYTYIGHPSITKGMVEAITYARKANVNLHLIGGQVPAEGAQYRDRAMQMCDGKQVVWLGEVSNERKRDELCASRGFLFPVQQDEGSSLALMEAMSCGVPAITCDRAAYPELVSNDVGLLCETEDQYLTALANKGDLESFDRKVIRQRAIEHFSLTRMCNDYLHLYDSLRNGEVWN